ncbi:MAG TPA: precorrin-3B C(17)-methyltransferase [Acidimicrobiales bacterium]|nr:precorrin-3B C(17)-methyltransferase [Acidimicrobiales bacterium]
MSTAGPDGPRVVCLSVTERGRALAARLPFEHHHGRLAERTRSMWDACDAIVMVVAVGAAVRIVGPLLADKATDPAVVAVDDAGRYAVPVCGGHARDGNALARQVASIIGAEAVVTTATDGCDVPALDQLPGLRAEGDVAAVATALLDGRPVRLANELGWPVPPALADLCVVQEGAGGRQGDDTDAGAPLIVVTDRAGGGPPASVLLRPPSLVAGVGTSTGAPPGEVAALLTESLRAAGLAEASVAEVATIDRRATEPAVVALGRPVTTFGSDRLAAVEVPNPSEVVRRAVGTASVAEAAALLAAGDGADLVAAKRSSPHATVALARRRRPRGRLTVVGLGPGGPAHRTPAAEAAVRHAEVVVGYGPYVDQCADLLTPAQEVVRSPIGSETDRARAALDTAAAGRRVALVCSGDAGVYAMASLVLEEAEGAADVEVVPGVTAALAAAAVLGAPLGHDHAAVSLSDLLTPWEAIATRLRAVAEADMVVSLYNPRSERRTWQLPEAMRLLADHRGPQTPVGVVTDAGRPGQAHHLTTIADLDPAVVGMTSIVVVGSSSTVVRNGRMVTPRGYRR